MKKHCFLTLFGEHNAESSKNAVFRKRDETLFCHTFLGNVARKAQKRNFFRIFGELCTKCLEKREKKTVFSQFLLNVVAKSSKTAVFPHILRNFEQSVSANVNKHCFLTLFGERRAKSSKNVVFRIFCELCSKCLEKREKQCFLTLFAECRANSSKNAVFPHFLRTL